jgi:cell division protease FtsH
MVCEWGMSRLGPLSYEKQEGAPFLGLQAAARAREYSDATAQAIDREVFDLIDQGYKQAVKILQDHREALDRLSLALLEFETLDGDEVDALIKGASLGEIRKLRENKAHPQFAGSATAGGVIPEDLKESSSPSVDSADVSSSNPKPAIS